MVWLRSLAFTALFFPWTAAVCVVCAPCLLLPRAATVRIARFWARSSLALLRGIVGLTGELRGLARLPPGPCILAVKHQSAWETLALNVYFPDPAFVLKAELYAIPFFGWILRRSGQIAVDRKAGAGALKAMIRTARPIAAAGRRIVIFPQGTRAAPGVPTSARPYLPGVFSLYQDLNLPVVPVALNSGLFWGRRSFLKRPGTIVVEILPPLPAGLARPAFMAELETRIETATQRLIEESRAADPRL